MSTQALALPRSLDRIGVRARPAAIGAGALWALGALLGADQALRSYLFGFLFWIGVAIGCQSILMIHHLSGGYWGLGIRRILEAGSRTLRYAWIGFLPIALGLSRLFPWTHPDPADELVQKKLPFLNPPFFLGRAAFYFACWALLAHFLSRWSLERDETKDARLGDRLQGLSGGGLVLMGLTITFASVDWAMSLNPHWYSTIYGMLFMVGQALSALSFVIVLVALAGDEKPLAEVVSKESVHDLGKLLFAFVMLWAYVSLSQFLIVWSGNLPEEIPWYIQRLSGGWQYLALVLVFFHFLLPFLLLLSRDLKRNPRTLSMVAMGVFAVRLVDLFWLVAPDFQGHGEHAGHGLAVHWLDVVAPVFLGGLWLLLFVRELRSRPLLTPGDPELHELLAEGGRMTPPGGHQDVDFERRDVDTHSILQAGLVLGVVTVVAAVLVLFLFNYLFERAKREDPPNPPLARHEQGQRPPEPRLQEQPFQDIADLHAEENAVLEGYAWVDRRAGIARIPIEEAKKIVLAKGLPRWSPAPAAAASPQAPSPAGGGHK